MKTNSFLFTASIMLAMALTFSCSSSGDDNESGSGGNNDPFAGIPEYEELKEITKYYDPYDAEERCQNGVVEWMCKLSSGNTWYNPLKQGCDAVSFAYICDENDQCRDIETLELGTIERCGSRIYLSSPNSNERCQNGVFQRKCGDAWYSHETHYCDNDKNNETFKVEAMERCGNKYYNPEVGYTRCQNEVVEYQCGYDENETWYNYETHYCYYETVKARECGSRDLYEYYERCNNGVVESRCGNGENANWYNGITQSCDWDTGTIKAKLRCDS